MEADARERAEEEEEEEDEGDREMVVVAMLASGHRRRYKLGPRLAASA